MLLYKKVNSAAFCYISRHYFTKIFHFQQKIRGNNFQLRLVAVKTLLGEFGGTEGRGDRISVYDRSFSNTSITPIQRQLANPKLCR